MSEDTNITVSRLVQAPAEAIFDVLTLPARHPEFDGSGTVASAAEQRRIEAVGDVFVMRMREGRDGPEYEMENHVIAYVPDRVVGWAPATPGRHPSGWTWVYTLEARDEATTLVQLVYDWAGLSDKNLAPSLPAVPREALEESLARLERQVTG